MQIYCTFPGSQILLSALPLTVLERYTYKVVKMYAEGRNIVPFTVSIWGSRWVFVRVPASVSLSIISGSTYHSHAELTGHYHVLV